MILDSNLIVSSIREELEKHSFIRRDKLLIDSVYKILSSYFLNKKKYVICELPTGSGKTIIGMLTFFCYRNILKKMQFDDDRMTSYFLTSSKILQDQIERDINRFNLDEDMYLLEGVSNYLCTKLTEETEKPVTYDKRPCRNVKTPWPCFDTCPYKVARITTAETDCAVFNYAYFLNIMRGNFNPFFKERHLTIADECHLLPDIVCNMFNIELTPFIFNGIKSNVTAFQNYYGNNSQVATVLESIGNIMNIFQSVKLSNLNCLKYLETFALLFYSITEQLKELSKHYGDGKDFQTLFEPMFTKYDEELKDYVAKINGIIDMIKSRPEDLFIENEQNKYIIRDLCEHRMVKEHFLSKINHGLFMSATIGNADEFAELMGMEQHEYTVLKASSNFDFSASPIFVCESGKLSFNEFQNNIDKVLSDAFKICEEYAGFKGVIHTGTFAISQKLEEQVPDELRERFVFYDSTNREDKISYFIKSTEDKILVGPSLYEGLDLKDDLCRFQILVKVPYSALNRYIRVKMDRYPFWYQRNCNEKIIQAIGRSNRHKDDWSHIYLLDSVFKRIVLYLNDSITSRLKKKKISGKSR